MIVNIKEVLTDEIKAMETGVFIRQECLFHLGIQNTTGKKMGHNYILDFSIASFNNFIEIPERISWKEISYQREHRKVRNF